MNVLRKYSGALLWRLVVLLTGIVVGFFIRPLLRPELQVNNAASNTLPPMRMAEATQLVAACNFDPDQLDKLAGRLAPLLVKQFNPAKQSGITLGDSYKQNESPDQEKTAKIAAFSDATQIVDQMIAGHRVSHERMADAIKLLQQSGQADRTYELHGKIAAAMNRGELTPEEAGIMAPRSLLNQTN